MIRDLIERFRYRFQLWHRERREDLFGMPRSDPRNLREYTEECSPDKMSDPSYAAVVVESTLGFVGRSVGVYFGVIIILGQLYRVAVGYFPSAHSTIWNRVSHACRLLDARDDFGYARLLQKTKGVSRASDKII